MLDAALKFLATELNAELRAREGGTEDLAKVLRPIGADGKLADFAGVGLTLVNLEEERVLKHHLPDTELVNGQHVVREPKLKLNLLVLVAAYQADHEQALKALSQVITFFQGHPFFTRETSPALDAGIEKLVLELQSLTLEQLNQIWAVIGLKQLPSVFYRVRMVALQDRTPRALRPPITTLASEASVS